MRANITHYWTPRDQDRAVLREYIKTLRDGAWEKAGNIALAVIADGDRQLAAKLRDIEDIFNRTGTLPVY